MIFVQLVIYLLSFVFSIHGLLDPSCFLIESRSDPNFINFQLPDIGFGLRTQQTARHHVLSYNRISFFFNQAIQHNNDVRRELIEISLLLLENANRYFNTPSRLATKIALEHLDSNFRMPSTSDGFIWLSDAEEMDALQIIQALWVWMPFNYVIGPRHRSDDTREAILDIPTENIIGQRNYNLISDLNTAINHYLNVGVSSNGVPESIRQIRQIVTQLLDLEPVGYGFDPSQWTETMDANGNPRRDENGNVLYHIRKGNLSRRRRQQSKFESLGEIVLERHRNERQNKIRNRRKVIANNDSYCFETYKSASKSIHQGFYLYKDNVIFDLKSLNLMITYRVFMQTKNGTGFSHKNYDSWKQWYDQSTWNSIYGSIYNYGTRMALYDGPFGFYFNDGSFVVGIISRDIQYGITDNWVGSRSRSWGTASDYAGQIYFDKNGRPVALAITDTFHGDMGSGWSYIYNNDDEWEYEFYDDWHTRRFPNSALSLNSHAVRFFRDTSSTHCIFFTFNCK